MSAKVLENSPQSPNLYESQSKKIRRSFFKNDVAVKSYKCDFTGVDIWTSAKLYVSNKSLYVVHRPKRKKMTTISFSEISSITQKTNNSGVDIGLLNGSVYSLTNFQRPESAIAFLLNFWSLTRKDKPLQAGNTCLPPSGGSDNSSSADASRDLTAANSLSPMTGSSSHLPSPGPITVSLNSSASMSETDSLDSRRMTGSHDAKSLSSTQISANGERANRASTARTVGRTALKNSPGTQSAEEPILPVHSTALQKATATNLNRPTTTSPQSAGSQISQPPESVISKRLSVSSSVNRAHIPSSASAVELKHQGQQPVYNNSSISAVGLGHSGDGFGPRTSGGGGGVVDRTGTVKHRPVTYIPDPPGWSIWPLSFLPYPFSSPPQRLTMIIAYAILAFLLFSTMHLYHRLAVFDLSGNPILASTGGESHVRPLVQPSFRSTLHQLESQLSQLVELTGQLTQSLIRLNSEVRNMQFQADSITQEPMVAADIKPS
ncbi:unnamed protein product [Calicophoron daubneyi]|uniref:GRAM domain-containing protein n=1 Tax=Calicophoron daubneyi TaxID=300641 RepID=A0AAV2TC16_CALDB